MARYCPPARRRVTRCYAWVMSPAPSGASATGLAAVQLRRGVGHLGAVCLLLERSVLVDALLPGVLAVQGLAHLGLEIVVGTVRFRHRSSWGRCDHHVPPSLGRSTGNRADRGFGGQPSLYS